MVSQAERDIEIQARVIALEHLVKNLIWNVITLRVDAGGGGSEEVIQEAKSLALNFADQLETASLPAVDPALSDHATALVRENVERVFAELVAQMQDELGVPPPSARGAAG